MESRWHVSAGFSWYWNIVFHVILALLRTIKCNWFFFLFSCQNTYPFWQFHRVRPGRTLDMTVLHNRVVVYCRLLFMFWGHYEFMILMQDFHAVQCFLAIFDFKSVNFQLMFASWIVDSQCFVTTETRSITAFGPVLVAEFLLVKHAYSMHMISVSRHIQTLV